MGLWFRYSWGDLNHRLDGRWDDLNPSYFRFPFESQRGAQRMKEGALFIHSFVHCVRSSWRMSMRSVLWGCLSLGASFHGGRLLATCFVYLLERFYFCGGCIAGLGRISCRRTSSHQIAVRSVAEGGHSAELHSCGGVSRSELTVCSWSRFSGFGSLYVGRTFLGRTWWLWACISTQFGPLLYQVLSYIVLAAFHLLSSYIHIHLKLVFPGGVLSRVLLTKNTYVYKCID